MANRPNRMAMVQHDGEDPSDVKSPSLPTDGKRRWFFRVKGGFVIVSSLAVGMLAWLVLSLLAENLRRNPDVIKGLPWLVNQCISHRALMPLAALPALVCGIMLLPKSRSRASGWLLTIAATAWLFGLFGLILYCFVSFLAPLYQYQPL